MKYLKFLALILLGVVSSLDIEQIEDEPVDFNDPIDGENDLDSLYGDNNSSQLAIEWPYDIPGTTEDVTDDVVEDSTVDEDLNTISNVIPDTNEPVKHNRLSCPFSGQGCRFKKAKCVCESKDNKFKFVMKKFSMIDDDVSTDVSDNETVDPIEPSPSSEESSLLPIEGLPVPEPTVDEPIVEEPTEEPIVEEVRDEPTPEEILEEIPSVVEGFESLEKTENPKEIFENNPEDDQIQPIISEPDDEFEDKTIRVRTGDENDAHKKVREYEYLRVKKLGESGVEERHLETPETQNPSISYHKGVMKSDDFSNKSKLSNLLPIDGINRLAIETPITQPETSYSNYVPRSGLLAIEAPPSTQVSDSDPDRLALTPTQHHLSTKEQLIKELEKTNLQIERLSKENELQKRVEAAENIQNELLEIEKRESEFAKNNDMAVDIYKGPTQRAEKTLGLSPEVKQVISTANNMSLVPYTGSSPPALRGLKQIRSLKSKNKKKKRKGKKAKKPNRTKEQKKADKERKRLEKKRRKELKNKSKKINDNSEKKELAKIEKLREKERIIDEKLDKLSEDLEDKQITASQRARQVKSLQMKKEKQQKKIDLLEKRLKMKREYQKKSSAKERLDRIKKEQLLLKQQENEIDQMSKDTEHGSMKLFETREDEEEDDE